MTSAATGETNPEAGVTATSPATMPDASPNPVGLPRCIHSTATQLRPAAAAATCDAVSANAANGLAAKPLPPLNPNQPNHERPAPVRVSTMLLGRIARSGWPSP